MELGAPVSLSEIDRFLLESIFIGEKYTRISTFDEVANFKGMFVRIGTLAVTHIAYIARMPRESSGVKGRAYHANILIDPRLIPPMVFLNNESISSEYENFLWIRTLGIAECLEVQDLLDDGVLGCSSYLGKKEKEELDLVLDDVCRANFLEDQEVISWANPD